MNGMNRGTIRGIGTASAHGDVWRTEMDAKFVEQTKAVIGTMRTMGLNVDFVQAYTRDQEDQEAVVSSFDFDPPSDSALRMLRDGDIEIAGGWWIEGRHPGTEGIDGKILIGFTADHGIERGSIQFTDRRGRGAWLSPDNDPSVTIGLVAGAIHDRFIGVMPWTPDSVNSA